MFVSEPRFESLPVVLETGREDGRVTAADVALVRELRERGLASRAAG